MLVIGKFSTPECFFHQRRNEKERIFESRLLVPCGLETNLSHYILKQGIIEDSLNPLEQILMQSRRSKRTGKHGSASSSPEKQRFSVLGICLFVSLESCLVMVLAYGTGILLPTHILTMVGSTEKTFLLAIVNVITAIVGIVFALLTGVLSDIVTTRFGRRKPFVFIGLCLSICALVVRTFAAVKRASIAFVALYIFLYCVETAGFNIALSAYKSMMPDLIPEHQMGLASGLFGFANILGIIASTFAFGLTFGYFPIYVNTLIVVSLLVVTGSAVLLAFKEPEHHYSKSKAHIIPYTLSVNNEEFDKTDDEIALQALINEEEEDNEIDPSEGKGKNKKVNSLGKTVLNIFWYNNPLTSWNYFWTFLARMFFYFGMMLSQGYALYFFADAFHNDFSILLWDNIIKNPVQASSLCSFISIGSSLISSAAFGVISDKFGRKAVVYFSCVMGAVGYILMSITRVYSAVLAISIFSGVGLGAFQSVDLSLANDVLVNKANIARDLAIWQLAITIPRLLASPLSGSLIGICDSLFFKGVLNTPHFGYTLMFALSAVLQIIAAISMVFVRITKKAA